MKTTRCLFNVASVTDFGNDSRSVKLTAAANSSVPAEQSFAKYTPSGSIELSITNPNAFGIFTPGAQVYVDISQASTP